LDVVFEEPVVHAHACLPDGVWPFQKGDKITREYEVAVRDNGTTRTTLSVENTMSSPSTDSVCAMQDACGAIALGAVADVDGTTLHSGQEHVATMAGTTRHWYVGRAIHTVLSRTSCHDTFDMTTAEASVVEIANGPSIFLGGDAGTGSDASADAGTD
jgi:hypothetical protein